VDTLVVLMGVANREFIAHSLIAAGRDPDQPVAFVHRGTMAGETIIESTLRRVASGLVDVRSPAVFVIGEVVRLRSRLGATSQFREQPAFAGLK
jgi:siroheme synthase